MLAAPRSPRELECEPLSYSFFYQCTNVDEHVPRRIKACPYDYSIMQAYDKASIPLCVTRDNDICMLNYVSCVKAHQPLRRLYL